MQGWPQATQPITTNKNDNNQKGRSPTVQTTATSKNDKDCQEQQQPKAPHTPQVPPSPPPGKPPPTKMGRLIQPNNLLKVPIANVQSLSPKIDELIALIRVENFDVIALNETCRHTKQASTRRSFRTWLQGFSCGQTNPNRKGKWINHACQKYIEPKESHRLLAQGKLFKLTSIPRMQYT